MKNQGRCRKSYWRCGKWQGSPPPTPKGEHISGRELLFTLIRNMLPFRGWGWEGARGGATIVPMPTKFPQGHPKNRYAHRHSQTVSLEYRAGSVQPSDIRRIVVARPFDDTRHQFRWQAFSSGNRNLQCTSRRDVACEICMAKGYAVSKRPRALPLFLLEIAGSCGHS